MTFFCTNCWKEIDRSTDVCPHCGKKQSELGQEPFVKKLIRALKHPEPSTPVRAAEILGELKAEEALPYLIELTKHSKDPFIVKAAISSIKKIKDTNYINNYEQQFKIP